MVWLSKSSSITGWGLSMRVNTIGLDYIVIIKVIIYSRL